MGLEETLETYQKRFLEVDEERSRLEKENQTLRAMLRAVQGHCTDLEKVARQAVKVREEIQQYFDREQNSKPWKYEGSKEEAFDREHGADCHCIDCEGWKYDESEDLLRRVGTRPGPIAMTARWGPKR